MPDKVLLFVALIVVTACKHWSPEPKDWSSIEATLLAELKKADSYFDWNERRAYLQAAAIDTETVHAAALSLIERDYTRPTTRDQARSKVVALRFLQLTKHWASLNQCLELLEKTNKKRARESDQQIRIALLADSSELEEICERLKS